MDAENLESYDSLRTESKCAATASSASRNSDPCFIRVLLNEFCGQPRTNSEGASTAPSKAASDCFRSSVVLLAL